VDGSGQRIEPTAFQRIRRRRADLGTNPGPSEDPRIRGWRIEDGGWRMEDRGSRMEDRGSRMEERGSRMEDRGSRMEDGGWRIERRGELEPPRPASCGPIHPTDAVR
jgi:hypothetical protein